MEDLTGRGRTVLPSGYVAEHAEYGWASTIDSAQGATTDVGIVLVRPGLDREHLYVGMTRGRDGNHAYITPDPSIDPEHQHGPTPQQHGPAGQRTPHEQARDVLATALASSGAQDAAHTALDAARTRATEQARTDAERKIAADREAQRQATQTVPPEHAARAALLRQRRAEHAQLKQTEDRHRQQLKQARDELAQLPRWARGRRQLLTATISEHQTALARPVPALLTADIDRLAQPAGRARHPTAPRAGPSTGDTATRMGHVHPPGRRAVSAPTHRHDLPDGTAWPQARPTRPRPRPAPRRRLRLEPVTVRSAAISAR